MDGEDEMSLRNRKDRHVLLSWVICLLFGDRDRGSHSPLATGLNCNQSISSKPEERGCVFELRQIWPESC